MSKQKMNGVVDQMDEALETNDYLYSEDDMIDPFEEMKAEIQAKDEEIAQLKNKIMYNAADFENYKRNAAKDKANLSKYGSEKVIKSLLPIIDDFERAFNHITDKDSLNGMTLIYNKFITILNSYNVSVINPETGEEFTDTMHEAVSVVPSSDDHPAGTVAQCVERGYMLEDKVIRYAKVVVFN